jgi:hypothetical protein
VVKTKQELAEIRKQMMKKRIPKAGNDVRSEISKADIGGPVSLNELNNDIAKTPK